MNTPNPLRLSDIDMTRARLKMKRKIAAQLIAAMAETDADYEFMAKRLRITPAEVEDWITGLISGKTKAADAVSDLALAMACEFDFKIVRYEEPRRPAIEPEKPQEKAAA